MGGGGSSYFPSKPSELKNLMRQTQEGTEQKRLDSDVNAYLQSLLMKLNDRKPEKVQAYIDGISEALGEDHEIEKLLFGGSVAKHTAVDGLSDVDALVILDMGSIEGESPREFVKSFLESLQGRLTHDEVTTLDQGNLAVTVTYTDGTVIQLLPAFHQGREIAISDSSGSEWQLVNPKIFHRELTKANERLNHTLIPTIKLVKSIVSSLHDDIRPTGYQVEALSLEATKGYRGPMTLKSILLHVLTAASTLALRPIPDITNQSRHVDSHLGKRNSDQRIELSRALAGIARRLNASITIDRWKEIFED